MQKDTPVLSTAVQGSVFPTGLFKFKATTHEVKYMERKGILCYLDVRVELDPLLLKGEGS